MSPRPSRCDERYGYHEVLHLTTLVGNLVGLVLDCWDLATPLPPPPADTSAAALLSETLRTTAASIATYFVDDAVAAELLIWRIVWRIIWRSRLAPWTRGAAWRRAGC